MAFGKRYYQVNGYDEVWDGEERDSDVYDSV